MKSVFYLAATFILIASSCSTPSNEEKNTSSGNSDEKDIDTSSTTKNKIINFEIVPGKSVGDILPDTDEKKLIEIYGAQNVSRDTIWREEGMFQLGTCVFHGTPNEICITWKDAKKLERPRHLYIRQAGSKWKTKEGIALGTSLKELEKINAGEFTMTGFGWDFAGTVIEWRKGKMQEIAGEYNDHFLIRLGEPEEMGITDEEYQTLLGDIPLKSSNALLQKMNPTVYEMIVVLNE